MSIDYLITLNNLNESHNFIKQ